MPRLPKRAALWPLILYWGFMVTVIGVFTHLGRLVHRGGALPFDNEILAWFHEIRSALLTKIVLIITTLGAFEVLLPISAILVVALWFVSRRSALFSGIAITGAAGLNQATKVSFERARPDAIEAVYHVKSYSFPSGHSMVTLAFFLTVFLVCRRLSPSYKHLAFVAGVVLAFAVGTTRVYLGVHYPSDVLAGWCLGAAWVLGVNVWYRRAFLQPDSAADPVEVPDTETGAVPSEPPAAPDRSHPH